jgi:pyridoxal phosphate enzyme (YggS family)
VVGVLATDVAVALRSIEQRIRAACDSQGRDPAEVRLIAVSKTVSIERIREAYAAGARDFGESYAQELARKAEALRDLTDVRWHFIGHLQSNKARVVTPIACMVHSVDSVSLLRELDRRRRPGQAPLDVLIEVNVAQEPQKHGVAPAELRDLLAAAEACAHVRVRGLMTLPPMGDPDATSAAFSALARLRDVHRAAHPHLTELSMGMSSDLEAAVAAGATYVRVGTAIFGERLPAGAES